MMKKDWDIKKLEDVCEFLDSRRKPITANKRTKGPIPYYGATGILDYVADFLFDEELILLGEDGAKWGPGDKSAFRISGKTWVNNHAHVLKPKNMNYDWIIYYLNYSDLMKFVKGATVPKLNQENAKNISIPVPPLEEQKRIVKFLDEKFAQLETIKANAQTNLQNAKDLFQSQLAKFFSNTTWEKKRLGDVFYVKSGGTPSRSKKEYWNGDIPWYSSGELGNRYTTNSDRNINSLAIDNSNAKLFSKGSLLIGMYDTAAMKMSILDRDATFNQAIAGVKPNKEHNLQFIRLYLDSIKAEMFELRRGTRQKNLSLEKIKEIKIPLPPLPEQKRIVKELDALSEKVKALQNIYEQMLLDCEELKQSFLCKAFAGEL